MTPDDVSFIRAMLTIIAVTSGCTLFLLAYIGGMLSRYIQRSGEVDQ